ncbi:L-cysteine desulfhydrase [Corylus avellana]|uniref:L-cysteine desulfhydrase n=1 Tax=Corylus avellana TaxID=13451 RepID=UPI001E23C838|nr:L-cysteine desulfhydrase [Corylus avellana]
MEKEEDPRNGDDHVTATKKPKLTNFITESELRSEFSHHEAGVARINNGSFGCCPGSVLAAQRSWQLRFLQQPDHFYVSTLRPNLLRSRALIQTLINAHHIDEVSLVDNATTAAAIVLQQIGRRFAHHRNDTVIMFRCAFPAVKKSIQAYVTRAGASVVEVDLPFPVSSNAEIIAEFRKGLSSAKSDGRKVRLAIIDHITSMPSVVIPVRELVHICREEGVEQVFVDAAHAIGSVSIDVQQIGADFYVSNLYKWFFAPPSVAFLYCRKSNPSSSETHHPVVSHEYGNGLPVESSWIGTRDYTPQLVVPAIMEFVNQFEGGSEGIMRRNHEEVVRMGKMLAEAWGTSLGSPPEMCASMVMVGLPSKLHVLSDDDATRLRSHLRDKHGVEVPIYYRAPKNGEKGESEPRDDHGLITGYARISHQVYNRIEDYYKFRDAINRIILEETSLQGCF